MTLTIKGIPIEVHLRASDWVALLRHDAAAGLSGSPKELSPTWLYDDRGCELFEQITRLPEYYPTRTERLILAESPNQRTRRPVVPNMNPNRPPLCPPYYLGRPIRMYLERYARDRKRERSQKSS